MSVQVSAHLFVVFWGMPVCVPLILLPLVYVLRQGSHYLNHAGLHLVTFLPPHAYSCLDTHACVSFVGVCTFPKVCVGVGCMIVYVYGCEHILPPEGLEGTQEPGFRQLSRL